MLGSRREGASARAEMRLVAQPSSVPAARRFVDDALTDWGRETVADEIGLCVSELVTNATLHTDSAFCQVELETRPDTIRLAVADAGMGSVDVLARQPQLSDALLDQLTADDTSTTGRGVYLVAALATAWGIDELPVGKRVWAEFDTEAEPLDDDAAEATAPRLTRSAEREVAALDPEEWAVVRFRRCPAALLVAHDDNIAEFTRELQLIGDRLAEPAFQRLAAVMAGYVAEHAANWDPARIVAHEAVREGIRLVDFDVMATRNIKESIAFLRSLIWEAESLSRAGRLMTLPAPEPVQTLRDWLEGEFLAQVADGAEPLPYVDWLAGVRR